MPDDVHSHSTPEPRGETGLSLAFASLNEDTQLAEGCTVWVLGFHPHSLPVRCCNAVSSLYNLAAA